jgi:hypothetical protein
MRRNRLGILFSILVIGMWPLNTLADMYKWTDKDGNLQFSDTPPENSGSKVHAFSNSPTPCKLEQLVEELDKAKKINKGVLNAIVSNTPDGTLARSLIGQPAGMDDRLVPFFHELADEQDRCAAGSKVACSCIEQAVSGKTGPRSLTPATERPSHATTQTPQKTPSHTGASSAEPSRGERPFLSNSLAADRALRKSPTSLGPEGGAVKAEDGAILTLSRKSLTSPTEIEITPLKEDELPIPLPMLFTFAGAYQMKLGTTRLYLPAQLIAPGNPRYTPGAKVVVLHPSSMFNPVTSTTTPCWAQIAEGTISSTRSPETIENTMPGIRWGALYVLGVIRLPAVGKVKGRVNFFFPRDDNSIVYAMTTLDDGQSLCQGIDRGHSDYTMLLPIGSHTIRIVETLHEKRKEIEQPATVERGKDTSLAIQFINMSH